MLYRAINKEFGGKTVMKGLNADQRGFYLRQAWDQFESPVAIGLDASRFDQHVSPALLQFEHSFYDAVFDDAELRTLLSWQLENTGRAFCWDGRVHYTVHGSRMSGDMNTSLGNVVLMCTMLHAYLKTKDFRCRLINDGDDCVLVTESANVDRFGDLASYFGELGMVMKVEEPVRCFEEIVFCQSQPIAVGGSYRMVRDPHTTVAKDLVSVKRIFNSTDWVTQRKAISDCGLALAGDMPIFWRLYTKLGDVELSKRARRYLKNKPFETGADYLARGMAQKCVEPSVETRLSFFLAFGITIEQQIDIEKQIDVVAMQYSKPVCTTSFSYLFVTY
jgi:hypothetical protein